MKRRSGPISRVLSWTIIYLACTSPCSSSHATRARAGPTHGAPIRACSGRGLPSRRVATTLVVSYTTVSAFLSPVIRRAAGVFFSAALIRRVAPPGRWPASCPMEPGLSSRLPRGLVARSSGPLREEVLYHVAGGLASGRGFTRAQTVLGSREGPTGPSARAEAARG